MVSRLVVGEVEVMVDEGRVNVTGAVAVASTFPVSEEGGGGLCTVSVTPSDGGLDVVLQGDEAAPTGAVKHPLALAVDWRTSGWQVNVRDGGDWTMQCSLPFPATRR